MQGFDPPAAELVRQHLYNHAPQPPSPTRRLLPIVVVFAMLLTFPLVGGLWGLLLPWLAIIGLIIYINRFQQQRKQLAAQCQTIQDQVTLRRFTAALRAAWALLEKLQHTPGMNGQTVAAMAHCFDQLQHTEQAEVAYQFLLDHLPDDHPAAWQIQLNQTGIALRREQLADADDLLRKLRPVRDRHPDPTFVSQYTTAQLAQMILTQHNDEAIELAPTLVESLRPLGVDAGYGHGLLALAYHRKAQRGFENETEQGQARDWRKSAKQWWDSATLLIPASTLCFRYPSLNEIDQALSPVTREAGRDAS